MVASDTTIIRSVAVVAGSVSVVKEAKQSKLVRRRSTAASSN